MRWPILGLILLTSSCSSVKTDPQTVRIEADPRLVVPYTDALEGNHPLIQSGVFKFNAHQKTLFYAAVHHVPSKNEPIVIKSHTIQMIQKIFDENSITAVVVEGFTKWAPWREGELPSELAKNVDRCEANDFQTGCGETMYALSQARKKHAKIFRGEPTETEAMSKIQKAGYTLEDLLVYYVVRMIPGWKNDGQFNPSTYQKLIEERIEIEKKTMGLQTQFDFSEFNTWFKKHMNAPASYSILSQIETGPRTTPNATFIQRISAADCIIRDQSIVERIADALNETHSVFVIYGSSHYFSEKPALEKMMGEAIFLKI